MNTTDFKPTFAYIKDAIGCCWATCAFADVGGELCYAWAVRSPHDRDHRPLGRRKALARLKEVATFDWQRRVCREFAPYCGCAENRNLVVAAIQETSLSMIGRETDIGVFKGALLNIRHAIAQHGTSDASTVYPAPPVPPPARRLPPS